MALQETPYLNEGWQAANFSVKGTDDQRYTWQDVRGDKGTLVMFICNHCPYVLAIVDRLPPTVAALKQLGIGTIAIMSNDTVRYPADAFPKMKQFASAHQFNFPYCIDEDQSVARAYQAACTPDFFGFDAEGKLRYRGRLDSAGRHAADDATVPELLNAMRAIAGTGRFEGTQFPAIGCSIKWK